MIGRKIGVGGEYSEYNEMMVAPTGMVCEGVVMLCFPHRIGTSAP